MSATAKRLQGPSASRRTTIIGATECALNGDTPQAGQAAYAGIEFRSRRARSAIPTARWCSSSRTSRCPRPGSQVAADIIAQKYFRKAGVAKVLKKVEENAVPSWLWRSVPDEKRARQAPRGRALWLGNRLAARSSTASPAPGPIGAGRAAISTPRKTPAPSSTSSRFMLATQRVAPNSPQWFNTGLHWAYGIDGPGQGHFYVDPFTHKLVQSKSAYEHPQPHACFIQSVNDDLVNEDGIMDLWVREARLFKYGSGTGTNFSAPARRRREALGRRQVVGPDELPQDRRPRCGRHQVGRHHPPRRQDGRGRHRSPRYRGLHQLEGEGGAEGRRPRHRLQDRLQAPQGHHEGRRELRRHGRRLLRRHQEPGAEARGPRRQEGAGAGELHPAASSSSPARATPTSNSRSTTPTGTARPTSPSPARTRTTPSASPTTSSSAVETDGDWNLTGRARTARSTKTLKARDLWEQIGYAAWASADPGIQYHTTINEWHTCPAAGPIVASQPVLGIHVPRRHRLQPRLGQPAALPQCQDGTFDVAAFEHTVPALDRRPRNLGDDGAVPVARPSPSARSTTARWASATPISAAC